MAVRKRSLIRGRGRILTAALLLVPFLAACHGAALSLPGRSQPWFVHISLTRDGCAVVPDSAPAGAVTFYVTQDATATGGSVRLLQQTSPQQARQLVNAGATSSFSRTLRPGGYQIACNG